MEIGEGFVGEGPNAAHVNTVLGERAGPVGTAWATALATPSSGHAPFMVVARPGVAVTPPTLFVNKAAIAGPDHANMTWGAAQAGVARGVATALEEGALAGGRNSEMALIVAVWVNPEADDAQAVYANNAQATLLALRSGKTGGAPLAAFLEAAAAPFNPFFQPS